VTEGGRRHLGFYFEKTTSPLASPCLDHTTMPPQKSPIWNHFLSGEKQNGSHVRAHCRGCIKKERPDGDIVELDDKGKPKLLSQSQWVIEGNLHP